MSVTLDLNHADQGLIKDQGRSYTVEDGAKSRDLNRFQKDLALLSHVVHRFGLGIHYPHIETADNQMTGSAIADKVILDPGTWVMIGGVPINTSAIVELDRTFNIPDSSTRFLRLSLGANCGQATLNDPAEPNNPDWVVTRDHVLDFNLVTGTEDDPEGTGGGPSSPTSMRIFKAVKAGAGGIPQVTWYVNNAHAHVGDGGFQTAAQTYFDNGVADLAGAPNEVQSAIEAAVTVLRGYYVDAGAANAYAITTGRTSLQAGESFLLKIGAGNTNTTSACTLQVDSIAAKSIYLRDGATGPPAGYLRAGWHYQLIYNGTAFEIISDLSSTIWLASNVTVLSGGTATTWTQVDCSGAVPAGAKIVYLQGWTNYASPTGNTFLSVRKSGGGAINDIGTYLPATYGGIRGLMACELDSSRRIDYQVSNAGLAAQIDVLGYVI